MSDNSYLVLARKYRPQNFGEIVGQEILVETLSNAIKNNKLHHAYILTGIRGVGKTTTARIIAKTLNCLDEEYFKNAKSCDKCKNCLAIASSKHQDVIEFDAASKTGVDDIREIIDSIAYAPILAKYKIYIIDEFHMLSKAAFNSLLKTLEEPPKNVKFIFATTEIKKVPITILSRCQRFDLRRMEEYEISSHLKNILAKENYEFEDGSLEPIAKMADGSIRDSLSLLDQALSANNHQKILTAEIVSKMLNLGDIHQNIELFNLLLQGDIKKSYIKFNEIYNFNPNISSLIANLLEICNEIMKAKLLDNNSSFYKSLGQDSKSTINEIIQNITNSDIVKIWTLLSRGYQELSYTSSQRNSFEMLMMRICYCKNLINLQNIDNNIKLQHSKNFNEKKLDEKHITSQNNDEEEIANEILRNFEGSKIISK